MGLDHLDRGHCPRPPLAWFVAAFFGVRALWIVSVADTTSRGDFVLAAGIASAAALGALLLCWPHPAAPVALGLYVLLRAGRGAWRASVAGGLSALTLPAVVLGLLWWGAEVVAAVAGGAQAWAPAQPPGPRPLPCPTCGASLDALETRYTTWGLVESLTVCPACKRAVRQVGWEGADGRQMLLRLLWYAMIALGVLCGLVLLAGFVLLALALRLLPGGW